MPVQVAMFAHVLLIDQNTLQCLVKVPSLKALFSLVS